jgi:hypothetical protein
MTETFRPTLRTQADLEQTWRRLMEPLGFSGSSIWMLLVGPDDRPFPQITQIEECDAPPTPDQLAGFAEMVRDLLGDVAPPGGRWAFLRSRPGGPGVTDLDRAWARALLDACRDRDVPTEVMHLATDVDVVPLPYDELAQAPGAA